MKNFYLIIIYGLILVLSILCIITMKKEVIADIKRTFIVYSPQENNDSKIIETYNREALLKDLQPQYRLGFNGIYEPSSLCSQPITALPFNEGLKPCIPVIQ